ncbi:3,5-dihydroxyphenylacetyl-CoA synthase [subsurface metagenome]
MQPKIISIGYAVPETAYSQEQIFHILGYPEKFRRIFRDSGIEKRHFCLPLEGIKSLTFQEQQEEYIKKATALSKQAVLNCLDGRGLEDIGCFVYGSCTGLAPGPTIPHYLMRFLKFPPSLYITNIIGQGCESGFPNLRRAYDFTIATGRRSLVVNCELCSLTYFPERDRPDPENHFELLRGNSLFADAAACALVGFDDDPKHPAIVDTETYTNTDFLGDLGYTWRDGRLRILLSRRVPELAPLVVKPAVEAVLERQKLGVADIEHWILHAAGNTVLDNIRDALGIAEEKVRLSRETLRLFGNTSSTSVGITGKRLMEQDVRRGDYAAVLSIGPGMTGGATILKFGG